MKSGQNPSVEMESVTIPGSEAAEEAIEQAQSLVEEKESEMRFRHYAKGFWGRIVSLLLILFSVFQLYASLAGTFDAITLRSWHIMFLLVLSFLLYPAWKHEKRDRTRPTIFDGLCIVAGLFAFGFLVMNYTEITLRGGYFLPVDYVVASIGVIICFEMARRVVGNLAWLALVFMAYNFVGEYIPGAFGHAGYTWNRVVEHMFWGSQGLLGVGVGVSATYIFLFVLFGAFLKFSGFSDFINDLALTLVGRTSGGTCQGFSHCKCTHGHDQRQCSGQCGNDRCHNHSAHEKDWVSSGVCWCS